MTHQSRIQLRITKLIFKTLFSPLYDIFIDSILASHDSTHFMASHERCCEKREKWKVMLLRFCYSTVVKCIHKSRGNLFVFIMFRSRVENVFFTVKLLCVDFHALHLLLAAQQTYIR